MRQIRRPVVCFGCLLWLVLGCQDSEPLSPQHQASPREVARAPLEAGNTLSGEIASQTTVSHALEAQAGQAIFLEVKQASVDIVVEIRAPDRSEVLTWDTPTHRAAPERVCFVTETPGTHTVAISPFQGTGNYSIRLLRRGKATARDTSCFAAAKLFMSAMQTDEIASFERAAGLWEQAEEPFLAGLAWREAASRWRNTGATERAVDRFERALSMAGEAPNSYLEVSVLNRLGLSWSDLGDVARAQSRFQDALERAEETGDAWGRASALTNLGRLDNRRGRPHLALDRFAEAIPLWRQIGNPLELGQALLDMATTHGVLDHHELALDLLEESLELTRQARNENREANVLAAKGWIRYLQGQPKKGIPVLERVLEIRRNHGNRLGEAAALDRLGTLLREAGNSQRAERAYRESLALSTASGSAYNAAATRANLGCLFVERPQKARVWLHEALQQYQPFDDPRAVSHIEYCLAQAAEAAGDIDGALQHAERALSIIDQMRETARASGHYYRPIWLWQKYAEFRVNLLLRRFRETGSQDDLERAFETADLARARTLFEQVIETRAGVRSTVSDSLLAAERAVQEKLRQNARRSGDQAEREILRLQAELERLRGEIRAADPHHASTSPRSVPVGEAQRLLSSRTMILSYILGPEGSYLLTLDRTGLRAYELAPRSVLESYAESFHQAVQESHIEPFQWQLIADEIGQRIIPLGAIPSHVDRLIVVPDGLLHYVPFAALPSTRDPARHLIEDFQISYVPSVSVLATLHDRGPGRNWHPAAIFADPIFSPEDERLSSIRTARLEPHVPRLRHSASEALAIANLLGSRNSTVHLGFEASRKAILEMELGKYNVLHFATHAWIDEQFPELSGLFFSRFDPTGKRIDPELRLHEIHGLALDAELTVLSGCETALGEQVDGNGIEGFTHGFLYAGSSRVLVTQWKVDDQATAHLMERFYRTLLAENDVAPSEALQAAQIWLLQQPTWNAPFYWAPFVLQGVD